ncbi:hypothetical protein HHK36_026045 [Tetracentron sinense]|uniref:Ribonucleotide reductase large subunit C-terminal domain-containing protein n=1 Tax=Tetracentron sinense TaxID=13715 RepID=A0A834YLN4_TETSI|nr:hypothetical protein HHK36_026045 [Tetracentron sinense]
MEWQILFFTGMPSEMSNRLDSLTIDRFETIYYHALRASSELAAKAGPYETYDGNPVSKVCELLSLP